MHKQIPLRLLVTSCTKLQCRHCHKLTDLTRQVSEFALRIWLRFTFTLPSHPSLPHPFPVRSHGHRHELHVDVAFGLVLLADQRLCAPQPLRNRMDHEPRASSASRGLDRACNPSPGRSSAEIPNPACPCMIAMSTRMSYGRSAVEPVRPSIRASARGASSPAPLLAYNRAVRRDRPCPPRRGRRSLPRWRRRLGKLSADLMPATKVRSGASILEHRRDDAWVELEPPASSGTRQRAASTGTTTHTAPDQAGGWTRLGEIGRGRRRRGEHGLAAGESTRTRRGADGGAPPC
jgi:hypothetical protein